MWAPGIDNLVLIFISTAVIIESWVSKFINIIHSIHVNSLLVNAKVMDEKLTKHRFESNRGHA